MACSQSATDPRVDVNSGLLGSRRVVLGLQTRKDMVRSPKSLGRLCVAHFEQRIKDFIAVSITSLEHVYNTASHACNMHLCATAKRAFTPIYNW